MTVGSKLLAALSGAVTVRLSTENHPLRDRTFHLVFAGELLEHLDAPHKAVHEWIKVLRTSGCLCLSTPNGRSGELEGRSSKEHKHLFTRPRP